MPLEEKLRRIAGWLAVLVFALGGLGAWTALTGREFGAPAMDLWPIRASSAVVLVFLSGSLWLQHRGRFVRAGRVCAGLALAVIAAKLLESALGGHWIPETWVEAHLAPTTTLSLPSQAGLALALGAIALLFLPPPHTPARRPVASAFANLLIAVAATALLSFALARVADVQRPVQLGTRLAVSLLLLGVGIVLARPEDKHLRIFVAPNVVAALARRLFLIATVLPVLFSAVLVALLRTHALTIGDGAAWFIAATLFAGFLFAFFSIETAAGISETRDDAERSRVLLTAQLQEQAEKLQETVAQRTQELREANARLRAVAESNALLALVAQNTPDGLIITNAHSAIEWVNPAFERITGYTLGEVKGRTPQDVLERTGTDPAARARLTSAHETGSTCTVEILNFRKDGTPFWALVNLQPVRDATDAVVNFVAIQIDITAQRADQQRLQQLATRLELATRAAAIGVWQWDAATQRSEWDDRCFEIYGLRRSDFTGTESDWFRRVHPEDQPRLRRDLDEIVQGRSDQFDHDFRIIRASDGALRYVHARGIIRRDADGRPVSITGAERDVTADRETAAERESLNERLRLALRSSDFGVWEVEVATRRRLWDDRMFVIYGIDPRQFKGTSEALERALHPEDRAAALARLEHVLTGRSSHYEDKFRILRGDGVPRYLEAHGYLQRDAEGRPLRLVGLTRDVTAAKQMAQALELAEQRWQLALEGSNDSVWDWDVTTGAVYHDDRWPRMLGYEPNELTPTVDGWKQLAHPDDLRANDAALADHFAHRTPFYRHELRMRAKDGTWRWILDRGKVVRRAPDGAPLRMAGTHSDITAHKELEARLQKSEDLTNEVSRLAQIGGWEIDLVTSRVTWTEGTRRIHDVDANFQPTLESMWQFFPPEALAQVQAALNQATPAAPSFDIEVPLLTARGRRAWVRMLGHGEFDRGKAVSVHGAIQDVTARRTSEDARRELETQLFQAQKMETLGTLAGGIAHDFNNLLTGIIGYHELAADALPEDHAGRAWLAEARNASLRARELVEQILTFGRQSGGTEHGPIDLAVVIEEARRFLRATLPANVSIEVACAADCPPALADATQIHQVLLNLGSNAAHAMRHHGGTLRIALDPAEVTPDLALTLGGPAANSYVRLSVTDTGHGMDESTRRRIFDPFFTTKNTQEGTGLGLAVVHGIVRSHRGAIDVESTPGNGATFRIYLPTAEPAGADRSGAPGDSPRGAGEFVCVVDDEEVVGSCTKLVLESKGYRAIIFSSAEQCLAHTQGDLSKCAVLVTDQTMPGMQGTELAGALRRLKPDLPVVIMSGYFSKISPQALDELGQIELLAKPFTTDELAIAVHRALHPSRENGLAAPDILARR